MKPRETNINYSPHLCNMRHPLAWMDRLCERKRQEMYRIISATIPVEEAVSVLDAGMTAEEGWESANYFEQRFPYPERIVGLSKEETAGLPARYPVLRFVQGDAKTLPFHDASFDLAFSSAVIEHVGSWQEQRQFIQELYRTARRWVVFTTPNRWHPLELHTRLPLLHWLPKRQHRQILQMLGMHTAAQEAHLNLLSAADIVRLCGELGIPRYQVMRLPWLGFTSNLIVVLWKAPKP